MKVASAPHIALSKSPQFSAGRLPGCKKSHSLMKHKLTWKADLLKIKQRTTCPCCIIYLSKYIFVQIHLLVSKERPTWWSKSCFAEHQTEKVSSALRGKAIFCEDFWGGFCVKMCLSKLQIIFVVKMAKYICPNYTFINIKDRRSAAGQEARLVCEDFWGG